MSKKKISCKSCVHYRLDWTETSSYCAAPVPAYVRRPDEPAPDLSDLTIAESCICFKKRVD